MYYNYINYITSTNYDKLLTIKKRKKLNSENLIYNIYIGYTIV